MTPETFFEGPLAVPLLITLIVLALWTLIIKGIALWKSARNGQKGWFIAMLLINTVGILELVYLLGFAKKKEPVAS